MSSSRHSIGSYLIRRLQDYGVRHIFGIPGDYVLTFYQMLEKSPIKVIGVTREDSSGFAADAYSRINGMGAICVTYCVGGLNVTNSIAGAYAEKSPVVVITGSPGLNERKDNPMLHHKVKTFSTQREIFAQFTAASAVLDDPGTAFRQIDETLAACWRTKRPVYLEIPRDMVSVAPRLASRPKSIVEKSDPAALREALAESIARINASKRPVILADVEVHRYGLCRELRLLTDRTGIPVAATLLGKSVISERHPRYIGIYEGAMGRPEVQQFVEKSDCLLMLGTLLTDLNLGIYTAHLDRHRSIEATSEKIQISHHQYTNVLFGDFLRGLLKAKIRRRTFPIPRHAPHYTPPVKASPSNPLTVNQVFTLLNEWLRDDMVVICDTGLAMFGAVDLTIHRGTEFVAPAYYASMGFAVPAALGAQMARPRLRPVVIVGDGAFQMSGTELSTIAKHGLNPIVLVLNNHGYTTERLILEGPFNDIHEWRYDQLPTLLGSGWGCQVHTQKDFEQAWRQALEHHHEFSLLNIHLAPRDSTTSLSRLGQYLGECVKRNR
ncbi:MAG: thiamine pyrophosphate-binding protein [Verrucomicrobiae bacterium]|nr:thiamine pyrophosphate-binding protein [Verrucomicrobiae bacterium]